MKKYYGEVTDCGIEFEDGTLESFNLNYGDEVEAFALEDSDGATKVIIKLHRTSNIFRQRAFLWEMSQKRRLFTEHGGRLYTFRNGRATTVVAVSEDERFKGVGTVTRYYKDEENQEIALCLASARALRIKIPDCF